ncbi:MAG: FHA domain-containing protein, partial [Coriobacteriales bacterium]|nr:FHA domain-containing protein [Coriobacteriales bacterium]
MPLTCTVIRRDRVFNSVLPDEVEGKHWISDLDGRGLPRRLASIEAVDGSWQLRPQTGVRLYDEGGHLCEQSILRPDVGLYHLGKKGEATMSLLVRRPGEQDRQFTRLGLSKDTEISIGRSEHNRFKLSSPFVSANHALLRLWRGSFYLADCDSANGVYVNGKAIAKQRFVPLSSGDVITILGLKIVICARQIAFNNPKGQLRVRPHPSDLPCRLAQTNRFASDQLGRALQVEEEKLKRGAKLFHRSPRIRSAISERSLEIEDPPAPAVHEEPPALLRIGPSLCMALASAMMGLYMLSNLISEQGNMLRALPMLAMVVVMILGAVLWPNLQSRYSKKKEAKTEARRQQVYSEYLGLRWAEIAAEIERQRKILIENRVSVDECFRRVLNHDRSLFERTPTQHDFLELRLGTGDVPLRMSLRWPTGKLSLRGDPLLDRVVELSRVPQLLQAVPVAIALVEQYVCGILGVARPDTVGTHTQGRKELWGFLRGLFAQIAVLHAPDEVKIVLFVEPGEEPEWGPLANLPHLFDQDFRMRFTATNAAEAQALSIRLERELVARQVMQRSEVLSDYGAYYVVICANCELQHRVRLLSSLAEARENRGFSLISVADSIHQLPKECQRIIDLAPDDRIAGNKALGYRTALNIAGTQLGRVFCPRDQAVSDLFFATDKALANSACKRLADELASLQLPEPQSLAKLPRSIGFLEMFQVGKPEHLNISGRWQKSNPTYSLAAPLGIGEDGGLVMLDIHENAHGPHGLIAGMTGSGKSELIITWLLSMAISYRPDEVAFVLIDYKGGGLAGAFASAGARLPHVAGTITNLEGAAINRSLISIQSELRRRQAAFNRARDIAGLGTMDIYKYQELYRLGLLSEPMPHLLIVSDEFAELKDQQPEFMEQLVSAARIGRSLGVHLVLATQKPSGVVTDQIWSNARFKICLKVADSSDSNEMIKRPDAAELTDAGRFYQQVGYNEYFTQGQSAYAGSRYLPSEQFIPRRDDTVVLIDRIGRAQYALGP